MEESLIARTPARNGPITKRGHSLDVRPGTGPHTRESAERLVKSPSTKYSSSLR